MNRKLSAALATLTILAGVGFAQSSMAADNDGQWAKNHPRREQVNKRLANQDKRIAQERKEGELTKAQAAKLHREDHQIRKEEKVMAAHDGGHITKADQKALNQQENAVSKQIGK